MLETVTYKGEGGTVTAHIAKPDGKGPFPAIVLGQEVFGITDFMLDSAKIVARQGYLALVPDLHSYDATRPALTIPDIEGAIRLRFAPDPKAAMETLSQAERPWVQQAGEWLKGLMARQTFAPDLMAGIEFLKARPDVKTDRIGLLGFCMGGAVVGQALAQGADVKAGVILYGQLPQGDQIKGIKAPVMGHFGSKDPHTTGGVAGFVKSMDEAKKVCRTFIYEGAEHAFCNYTRPSYHPAAAAQAWERSFAFLSEYLKS